VILFDLALDIGDIVIMHKCLLGIKRRAEAEAEGKISEGIVELKPAQEIEFNER
jgi:hypothetical protein